MGPDFLRRLQVWSSSRSFRRFPGGDELAGTARVRMIYMSVANYCRISRAHPHHLATHLSAPTVLPSPFRPRRPVPAPTAVIVVLISSDIPKTHALLQAQGLQFKPIHTTLLHVGQLLCQYCTATAEAPAGTVVFTSNRLKRNFSLSFSFG